MSIPRPRVPAWIPPVVLGLATRVLVYPALHAKSWLWLPVIDGQDYLRRSMAGWKAIFAPSTPPFTSFLYPSLLRLLGVESRDSLAVLFAFQHVVGLFNLVLLYLLARRFARPWMAGLVTALWALVPIFAYWEHQVSPATVSVTAALALAIAVTSERPSVAAAAALAAVLAMLTPACTWPLLVAIGIWAFVSSRGRGRLRATASSLAVFLIVSMPLLATGIRTHVPLALTWESGIESYIGFGENATGTFRSNGPLRWQGYTEYLALVNDTVGRDLPISDAARLWVTIARRAAFANPGRTIGVEAKKIALAFSPLESPQIRSPSYGLRLARPAAARLLGLEWILVPAGFAGLLLLMRKKPGVALVAAALLVALALRYVSSAARLPLLALVAAGGASFGEALLARSRASWIAAALAVAALVLFGLTVRPPGMNDASEETRIAAQIAAQTGNKTLALQRSEEAVRLDPNNLGARVNFASMLANDGVYPRAAEELAAAVALDSTNVSAVTGLASLDQHLEKHAEAVPLYRRALETHPRNPQIWNDLGTAYLQLEMLDSAVVCFNRALTILPTYDTARGNLAAVQSAIAASSALMEAVLPAGASEEQRKVFLAALGAINTGNPGPAQALVTSLPQEPGDLRKPYLSAVIALQTGDNRTAAKMFEQCYRASPGNAFLALQLAQADRQIGQLGDAIEVLEDALRRHPQEMTLQELLQQYRAQTQ